MKRPIDAADAYSVKPKDQKMVTPQVTRVESPQPAYEFGLSAEREMIELLRSIDGRLANIEKKLAQRSG